MSTALIAWITTPRRPMLIVARYIVSHTRPTPDGDAPTTSGSSWASTSIVAGLPKPAVPTPTRPSASSSSTTTSHVLPGARPAVVVPRGSAKPSSTVSGVPTGRPTPFEAGRARGATVETCIRTTGAVIGRVYGGVPWSDNLTQWSDQDRLGAMPETTHDRTEGLELREAARHVMVDFNQMQTFTANPLIMVEGDGIRLTDHEGRRYIDGLS